MLDTPGEAKLNKQAFSIEFAFKLMLLASGIHIVLSVLFP